MRQQAGPSSCSTLWFFCIFPSYLVCLHSRDQLPPHWLFSGEMTLQELRYRLMCVGVPSERRYLGLLDSGLFSDFLPHRIAYVWHPHTDIFHIWVHPANNCQFFFIFVEAEVAVAEWGLTEMLMNGFIPHNF